MERTGRVAGRVARFGVSRRLLSPARAEDSPEPERGAVTAEERKLEGGGTATPMPQRPRPPTRRRGIVLGVLLLAAVAGFYLLLPKLAGLNQTWGRLRHGDPVWLGVAAAFEILSIAGYALLFRTIFGRGVRRLTWGVSMQIPLAGIAAIRLFAAAGAGSVAVTAWALARAGSNARVIGCRMVASLSIQYTVYLGAVVVFGIAGGAGLFGARSPAALTFLPAALAAAILVVVLSAALLPGDVERRLRGVSRGPRWLRRLLGRLATVPSTLSSGVRTALELVGERRPGLLGALAYWGFDIAVLGCSFRAFGGHPGVAVVVLGYLIGTLGSLLPLPGGVGGVEGGMIAAFVGFGVPADQAVVAVLAYRAISFWLPTLPGIAGYLALRRTVGRWERADGARGGDAALAAPRPPSA